MELPLVSPASCDSRSVIRFLAAKKNSAKDIHTELCQVYGEGCMSSGMVRRWVREFKNSRTDVHDEPRAGRPSDSYEIIAKVEAAMLEDRRVTVRKLCDLVPDISKTTIDKILREHLGYSKVCAILVPKMLTEDHKRQRVEAAQKFLDCHETDGEELLDSIVTGDETWVHYTTPETKEQSKQWKHTSSPKPLKFKQTLSAGKLMAPSFGTERAYCCATLCVGVVFLDLFYGRRIPVLHVRYSSSSHASSLHRSNNRSMAYISLFYGTYRESTLIVEPKISESHGNRGAEWPKPCDKFHTLDLTSSRQCSRQQATNNFPEVTSFYKLYMERLPRQQDDHQITSLLTEQSSHNSIHQNNSLNPIDKFNYLKSHLGGTALNTVEGFALSADNYEKAIKLLKDRFGREDILISRHMNNLLSMRPLKTSSDVRTFRELFDNLSVHIRSLESLNVSIDVYGQLLCPIIIKLLPADLNLELNKELPTGYVINDLITFLERQLTAREKSFRNEIGTGNESTSKPNLVNKHPKTRFYNEKPIATASELLNSVHKSNECVFCGKDNHGSPKCDFAANISLNEKRSLMKKKGVCYKCLRPSHLSKFCRNVVRCSICNMSSHLDVMCTKLILDRGGSSKSPTVQDETLANLSTSPDVLLPTLRVTLKGNRTEKTARAIIDTGSQRSYILHSTAMEMEYEQSRREFFRHSLFGGSSTDVVEHEVYTIHLSDINNSYRCEFEALGQPLICGSIHPVCPRSFLEGSEELDVSDLMRDRIEVLIGADIAGRLLTDDQRRISSGLVAIRTKLGWTVMGKIPPTEVRDDISSLCVTTLLSLDLENLWKLDEIGVSNAEVEKKTQSLQAEMEEHFAHTTTRDIEGRYEVALPWVQDKERIPSNKDLAENQLSSVRRKLEEVGDMNEYGQIFEEWMKQGIIEYAREDKLDGVHYLPHRPVYKRNSHTSRIRPVFNASARKRGKLSLNDCLDKGPNLIEIIPRLLNKFRKYEVGVSSDIEKAFLQIGIKEEDRDYLRFLWHTEDGRLITYRHKRVVFGITTSPYLLKATLSLHLDKAPEHLKITAEQLKSSFYVDNCLSSFQNVEETEKFVKESTELLSTACFNLRDWVSNVTDFSLMNQLNKEVNILGITWNTDRDTLTIGLEDFELIGPTTKRKVLSIASKIFDPLGVACPVALIPKLILQETWIQKLTWDEVLPGCLVQRFWKWFSKLKHLPNIEIPRWLCFKDSYVEKTTLHIFCDASQFAYATCIFLRIEKENRVDIQLIQARTRVAPLKKLTIPRLELLACLIGARLAANVIQDLEFEEIPRFYWTDSTNALCWIQREDNWAAFVMNRVKEIHNLSSPESWRHIPGRLNPADLPSRGCSAESLKETRWWEGPAWLKVSQEEWPKSTIIPDLEILYSERRKDHPEHLVYDKRK
ncbi:hypothetical protein LAZ67_3006106 [Cordylochernes scorpioides]|uniref:CCHC-type domain-containing protein n=1 Tax=Cordylochernes scorpioides TaxID=51811 RepID=A0ABY6KAX6_9ARAC|nr:hypothetical protein LAZ67_3006106 [Cordylochernes scorpioides]